jgi:arginine exporter protein ArgO
VLISARGQAMTEPTREAEAVEATGSIDATIIDATIKVERHTERLRQERETFDQLKQQDRRWSAQRLVMGWMAVVLLPAIAAVCTVVILNPSAYLPTTVGIASATLLADTMGFIFSVWKVVLGQGPARLRPITTAAADPEGARHEQGGA